MPIALNDEEIRQYWDDGYVVVPGILSSEEIESYKKRATEIARGDLPEGGEKMLVRELQVLDAGRTSWADEDAARPGPRICRLHLRRLGTFHAAAGWNLTGGDGV